MGDEWGDPIQLGILHRWSLSDKSEAPARLKEWQESDSWGLQIGPYFGLSRDYSEFISGLAPPFWALIASLMRTDQDAVRYILKQCWPILDAQGPSPYSAFWALWVLHIAASINSLDDFERARTHINGLGGLAPRYLYNPPSAIHLEMEDPWFEDFQFESEQIPELNTFLREHPLRAAPDYSLHELLDLTLSILLDEAAFYEWAPGLVRALAPIDGI
jgi:hypothetical protein